MSLLAIIPARGGSKGIPKKNIKNFGGKPLIQWTIEAALESQFIDKIIVSTENKEIADYSKTLGIDVPFLRDENLALDNSLIIDVILNILNKLDNFSEMILLQPTSPLRNRYDIDQAIKFKNKNKVESLVSISKPFNHPNHFYKLNSDYKVSPLMENNKLNNRQDYEEFFVINGAIYISSKQSIINNKSLINKNTLGYIMPKERSIDIDELLDWEIAEMLLNKIK
tara:strand:- start:701 stop:1375 length:675 start_codon:yes stop_codon:yes gene_type:complete